MTKVPPDIEHLLGLARDAAKNAHAPYSHFHVGAALLTESGQVIVGCNVENASFGVTICAERNAACHAVALNEKSWRKIAIVSPTGVSPCGACRQFLAEFNPSLEVWFGHLDSGLPVVGPISLEVLLPAVMKFPEV